MSDEEEFRRIRTTRLERQRQQAAEMRARWRENRRIIIRFVTGGNAGGAVLATGMIGTILGASSAGPIPTELFLVFAAFIFGLFASWVALVTELSLETDRVRASDRLKLFCRWALNAATSLASVTMLTGGGYALYYLHSLTG